jgi:hypothetical protein
VEKIDEAEVVRQINRVVRADLKRLYDWRRRTKPQTKPKKPDPDFVNVEMKLEDGNGVAKHPNHGKIYEFGFDTTLSPHQFRKQLIRKFRLKRIFWSLERQDRGWAYVCLDLARNMKVDAGDKFRIQIERPRGRKPNAPGTSKRVKYERANQRQRKKMGLKSYEWRPGKAETSDVQVMIRSAADPPPSAGAWGPGEERNRYLKFEWRAEMPKLGYKEEIESEEEKAMKRSQKREEEMKRLEEARVEQLQIQKEKEELEELRARRREATGKKATGATATSDAISEGEEGPER